MQEVITKITDFLPIKGFVLFIVCGMISAFVTLQTLKNDTYTNKEDIASIVVVLNGFSERNKEVAVFMAVTNQKDKLQDESIKQIRDEVEEFRKETKEDLKEIQKTLNSIARNIKKV